MFTYVNTLYVNIYVRTKCILKVLIMNRENRFDPYVFSVWYYSEYDSCSCLNLEIKGFCCWVRERDAIHGFLLLEIDMKFMDWVFGALNKNHEIIKEKKCIEIYGFLLWDREIEMQFMGFLYFWRSEARGLGFCCCWGDTKEFMGCCEREI
ncbi:hypothetical protein AMTRI_Chr03g51890 [Amborella trichopoda]